MNKKHKLPLRLFAVTMAVMLSVGDASAFCGFFVAKANTKLFNETSQVILVRDGNKSTITMSNDFKGDVKDFAMVVPVPNVLKRDQIRTVDQVIFDRFDDYSAPRLAEYYDDNPCYLYEVEEEAVLFSMSDNTGAGRVTNSAIQPEYNVTIEAQYTVGEYDILILSATESDGLKRWLNDNDYQIPEGAEEVLDPYIKSNMKFFVAKVNLDKVKQEEFTLLSPLQISFESQRFMLPIRLGMANATKAQDLVVYSFTKKGRVESTNYRTTKMPTDNMVPTFVKNPELFGYFYNDVFATAYRRQGKRSVFLEYAWDISGSQWQHCDPCVSEPPMLADLVTSGVDWITPTSGNSYQGDLFFTRLHVRYDRERFPQDLQFQETPNKERFQCRYVIHNPVTDEMDCEAADDYRGMVAQRRQAEMRQLVKLTRWNTDKWSSYLEEYADYLPDDRDGYNGDLDEEGLYGEAGTSHDGKTWLWVLVLLSLALASREVYVRVIGRSPTPR